MQHLTKRERITLLMIRGWGAAVQPYRTVINLFNETFRADRTGIAISTARNLVTKFEQTGTIDDMPKSGRPKSATNDDTSLDVLLSFTEDPHSSTRRISQQHNISKSSVHNVLKYANFHPFKVTLIHKLNEDDFDRRVEFCDDMMTRTVQNPNFPSNIVFSDEATFQFDGTCNRHNCRYWAETNPHWAREDKSQYPEKLNVWAGIFNNRIVGPFFIDGNLNAENYEEMLRNQIVPAIRRIAGDNFMNTWFQQDGAPAHYARDVRNLLDAVFVNRWIGRRGTIEWPARSPDLTPLDYFYWGYLKDRVYKTKPRNLVELRERIELESANISPEAIENVVNAFYHRLAYCQEVNGEQFEHLR